MKNNLQILIEAMQKEHDFLEQEMNVCIKDWDFLGAEEFRKSLVFTKQNLSVLKNLENPAYRKIDRLKKQIKHLKEYEESDEFLKSLFELDGFKEISLTNFRDEIQGLEMQLFSLENKDKEFYLDNDQLRICFEKLLDNEIHEFAITFNEIDIVIRISVNQITLKIEIRSLKNYSLSNFATKIGLVELKKMDFQIEEKYATREFSNFQKSKIPLVVEILARVYYDVFRLYGDGEAQIKLSN